MRYEEEEEEEEEWRVNLKTKEEIFYPGYLSNRVILPEGESGSTWIYHPKGTCMENFIDGIKWRNVFNNFDVSDLKDLLKSRTVQLTCDGGAILPDYGDTSPSDLGLFHDATIYIEMGDEYKEETKPGPLPSAPASSHFDLLDDPIFSDFKLILDDQKSIQVHRNILAKRSEYFERLFSSPMHENESQSVKIAIEFNDVIGFMLDYFYGLEIRNSESVSIDQLICLYKASEYYLAKDLKRYVEILVIKATNSENAATIAENFKSSEEIQNACSPFLRKMTAEEYLRQNNKRQKLN